MSDDNPKTHGGRRQGAGRPTGSAKPESRGLQVNVRLTDDEFAKALALGNGNASEGIRLALKRAKA